MKSQNAEVLRLLKKRRRMGLTAYEAATEIDCWRLAARVHELRGHGYQITTTREPHQHGWHARYYLKATAAS